MEISKYLNVTCSIHVECDHKFLNEWMKVYIVIELSFLCAVYEAEIDDERRCEQSMWDVKCSGIPAETDYFHWPGNDRKEKSNGGSMHRHSVCILRLIAYRNESQAIQMTAICSVNFHYEILCHFADWNRGGMLVVTYLAGATAVISICCKRHCKL